MTPCGAFTPSRRRCSAPVAPEVSATEPHLRTLPHRLRASLAALAVAVTASPGAAKADAPALAAPLGATTPGPIRQLFLDAPLSDARAVTRPQLTLRLETSNSWSVPTVFERDGRRVLVQADAQADALALAVRIPWSHGGSGWAGRVATTVGWRLTAFWGGFTDGGIEAWHHLVGAYNFLRSQYPRDHLRLQLADAGGRPAIDRSSGVLAPGDLVVGTQVLLLSGGSSTARGAGPADPMWGVASRLDLKIPIGRLDRAGGSGGFDAALSVLATVEVASWFTVHGKLTGAAFSPFSTDVALQPRRLHGAAEVSLVAMAGPVAFLVEDRYLSPLLEGGWSVVDGGDNDVYVSSAAAALTRPHNQFSLGVRYGPATLALYEDWTFGPNPRARMRWFYSSNEPDVVLALTVAVPL